MAWEKAELELLMIDETGEKKREDFDMVEMKQSLKKKGKKREAKEDDFEVEERKGMKRRSI